MDNSQIAERLEAFASLLEVAEANPYTARAYRRAAETIRDARVPVQELLGSGRVRDLRGIGPGMAVNAWGDETSGEWPPNFPEEDSAARTWLCDLGRWADDR